MRIVQITDTHIAVDGPGADDRARDLACVVDDINALACPPEVVIHTGDVAHRGGAGEYARAVTLLGRLAAPLYVAVGNRDDRAGLTAACAGNIGPLSAPPFLQYAIERHDVRLIALDTKGDDTNKGTLCDDRFALLENLLAADSERPAIVFMHHPPFDVVESKCPFQFEQRATIARLAALLGRHHQVAALLCGHAHRASTAEIGGARAMTAPNVAIDLRKEDGAAHSPHAPAYLIHDIDAGGALITTRRHLAAPMRRAG